MAYRFVTSLNGSVLEEGACVRPVYLIWYVPFHALSFVTTIGYECSFVSKIIGKSRLSTCTQECSSEFQMLNQRSMYKTCLLTSTVVN